MKQRTTKEELKHKLNHTSVPDPAAGWKAMQALLEGTAASGKPRYFFLETKRLAVAAVLLILIGFAAWQFIFKEAGLPVKDTPQNAMVNNAEIHYREQEPLPVISHTPEARTPALTPAPLAVREKGSIKSTGETAVRRNEVFSLPLTPLPFIPDSRKKTAISSGFAVAAVFRQPDILSMRKEEPVLRDIPVPHQEAEEKISSSYRDNQFHFSIRLNANGGASFGQPEENFNPVLKGTPVDLYPSVAVSKKITPKMDIRAGLAFVSPVAVSANQLKKSVSNPERAIYAMAAESRDEFRISRLYYADVPVTLQYHLSDRLSVGSGLQLSILEKVIGEKQRVDYSASNTVMYRAPATPAPRDLTRDKDAEAGINPLDVRWLGTLQYRVADHWIASLQFQYGLTDISENKAFLYNHKDRNTVISAGIGFLIK